MSYSIWSRGRLIGHTDLGFIYREHGVRVGWFHPNDLGEELMRRATGVAPAMRESREAGRDLLTDPDVASAFDHEQALEMELLGPNGEVIETENIAIIDTEYLLSIPDPVEDYDSVESFDSYKEPMLDTEKRWEQDEESAEPWRELEELPRYQIQAYLVDHRAMP